MNLNSSPSRFPMHQISHDPDHHQLYPQLPNPNEAPSIYSRFFFDPTQDHAGFYDHHQLYRPHHVPDDRDYGGSTYEINNKVASGLNLGVWKKEKDEGKSNNSSMKWMSSEMKHTDDHGDGAPQKMQPPSSSAETDLSSNSSSYNYNSPIRVCSDCNTTKTPLWRSGPNGPKSLCNACGIRQRKARRTMAAAAANGTAANTSGQSPVKIKLQHKGKLGKNGHASQLKKRCKTAITAAGSPSAGQKQLGFEDFFINLSKNLVFHRVFPDDVKDAAILLMALSSGLVNC